MECSFHIEFRQFLIQIRFGMKETLVIKVSIFSRILDCQKQSFADVLQNRCSYKFRKFHWKASVLESPFKKLHALRPNTTLLKETSTEVFSSEICGIFQNTFFCKTPLVVVSVVVPSNKSWNDAGATLILYLCTKHSVWKILISSIGRSSFDLLFTL